MKKTADNERPQYLVAHLETLGGKRWTSLHHNHTDAERKLRLVGEAWGVVFTCDGEPADGFRHYGIERQTVLTSKESTESADDEEDLPIGTDEYVAWLWLVTRDVPDGLSAQEMADDQGITHDEAAWRLLGIAALGLAREVTPGRFRTGTGNEA